MTGGLGGYVTDDQGKAVAGASVKVLSASQAASATTDASGHFTFLALAPDTYTVSIVKDGFAPLSESGVTVFADNQLALQFQLQRQLKTIANVTSTAAGALVKSGVGSDVYNVNSAAIQAAAALGGGSNLNSAYSAIAAVPGVNVTIGGMGWNQNVFIRGSQSFFTGYEYDGIPVNRAFDNYNASTESNLGLQELQVYTGGGPASNASSGTSGFINQVIKTGTYPGYASFSGGIATDAFYHQAKVEAGGASPDRNFSYYVGLSGYNQAFRLIDNSNGSGFMGPGGIYSDYSSANAGLGYGVAQSGAAYAQCSTADGSTPASVYAAGVVPAGTPWCLSPYNGVSGDTSFIEDRENVVNFHFAIPRKDGQRDDLQLLWSGSMLHTYFYGDVNDINGPNAWMLAADGAPYQGPSAAAPGCNSVFFGGPNNCAGYVGGFVANSPFGTPAGQITPSYYQFPDAPADTPQNGEIPYGQQDTQFNDQGIVKAQYTHAIGDRAYARIMGYTFFSDWNMTAPYSALANYFYGAPGACCDQNYLLITHTSGGQFQFSDQINDKNLVQLTVNQTYANVLRDNNTTATTAAEGAAGPFGIVSGSSQGNFQCWSPSVATGGTDSQIPCYDVNLGTAATIQNGTSTPAMYGVGPNAAAAGAQNEYLWSGDETAAYNTVRPNFTNVSLSDQWRPSDKWLVNAAIRYESYTYGMANTDTEADQFYAQQAADYFCYATPGATLAGVTQTPGVYSLPLQPGQFPPANPIKTNTDCNTYISAANGGAAVTGFVHPNGTTQDGVAAPAFTAGSPASYNLNYWSARYSATYTQSPDTVWRISGGRFIEPPISASIQYTNESGNNEAQWANFMDLGFFTPFHNTPSQTSAQYDISLERHIRGTDMSFKLTPFYNLTNGYQEQSFIGPGYVTQVPVGQFKSYGVEGAFTKGDFSKNGLSGTLALTYTKAQVQFQSGLVNNLGANQIGYYNTAIGNYNALAKGGSENYPCFNGGAGVGTPGVAQACTGANISNPYFSSPAQSLLDPNGWYA
ncbi:MAG: carboxypeptidase regulatory-like domain-containing protein, partial [Candidatus Aquilonibacter sp.]